RIRVGPQYARVAELRRQFDAEPVPVLDDEGGLAAVFAPRAQAAGRRAVLTENQVQGMAALRALAGEPVPNLDTILSRGSGAGAGGRPPIVNTNEATALRERLAESALARFGAPLSAADEWRWLPLLTARYRATGDAGRAVTDVL